MKSKPFVRVPFVLSIAAALAPPSAAQSVARVSVTSQGTQADQQSFATAIAAGGRHVAFVSLATNLVAGDTNGASDAFVHDRVTGVTERVSVSSTGAEADASSYEAALSADGRFVAFHSDATNLVQGDTNGVLDVFVRDRLAGTTERVSVGAAGGEAALECELDSLSRDGRFVVFRSQAANLVANDTNGVSDLFVRDRVSGATERVSVGLGGVEANGPSYGGLVSSDGSRVAFYSEASNLAPGDLNGLGDVFVRDRSTGAVRLVSIGGGGAGVNGLSFPVALTPDGRFVAFWTNATNIAPGFNGRLQILLNDLVAGTYEVISLSTSLALGDDDSTSAVLSDDARYVVFVSSARNLVPGDTNLQWDLFLRDRVRQTTRRVALGLGGVEPTGFSDTPSLSADGEFLAFRSIASNLVPGDTNFVEDAFVDAMLATAATYCGPAELNSVGLSGLMSASGSAEVTANNLVIEASSLPRATLGLFLTSRAQAFVPNPGGSQGTLCLGASIGRYLQGVFSTGATGRGSLAIDFGAMPTPTGTTSASVGETWNFQAWYRDSNPSPTSNFTDGLAVTLR